MLRAVALALLLATSAWATEAERTEALNEAGIRHLLSDWRDAAVNDFEGALKLEPQSLVLQRNLAAALAARSQDHRKAQHPAEALGDLDRAVELHPERLLYRRLRGEVRLELGGDGDRLYAREDFQWVLERDPDSFGSLVFMAGMDYADRRLLSCVQRYDRALALRPDDPGIRPARDRSNR